MAEGDTVLVRLACLFLQSAKRLQSSCQTHSLSGHEARQGRHSGKSCKGPTTPNVSRSLASSMPTKPKTSRGKRPSPGLSSSRALSCFGKLAPVRRPRICIVMSAGPLERPLCREKGCSPRSFLEELPDSRPLGLELMELRVVRVLLCAEHTVHFIFPSFASVSRCSATACHCCQHE